MAGYVGRGGDRRGRERAALVADLERVRGIAARDLSYAIIHGREMFGLRPLDNTKASRLDELEIYVTQADDPNFWQDHKTKITPVWGPAVSDAELMRYATDMENAIEQAGGIDAVRVSLTMARQRRVAPIVQSAMRDRNRAPIIVREPWSPWDELIMLAPEPDDEYILSEPPGLPGGGNTWPSPPTPTAVTSISQPMPNLPPVPASPLPPPALPLAA